MYRVNQREFKEFVLVMHHVAPNVFVLRAPPPSYGFGLELTSPTTTRPAEQEAGSVCYWNYKEKQLQMCSWL